MRDQIQARATLVKERLGKLEAVRKKPDMELTATKTEWNSLMPIYCFPNEILAWIFCIGCHEQAISLGSAGFEVLVSHATRCWREVALSIPALWTRIHRARYSEDPESLEKASVYLLRSQRVPIQLFIEIASDNPRMRPGGDPDPMGEYFGLEYDSFDDEIKVFCTIIEPHLHRCNRITLDAIDGCQGESMLEFLFSKPLPILSSIRVHFTNQIIDIYRWEPMLENGAPSLTHVYLTGQPNIYCRLPLRDVTTLRLELDGGSLYQPQAGRSSLYLASMLYLTHLELHHVSHWPQSRTLTLPALRKLICPVKDFSTDDVSELLLALNAPLLQDMTAGCKGTLDERLALSGSSKFPLLTRLCWAIGNSESASKANVQLLSEVFPFLTEIIWIVENHSHLRCLLDSMYDDDDGVSDIDMLWPRLESTGFATLDAGLEDFPTAELREFLVRRSQIGYPIRKLLLSQLDTLKKGAQLSSCTEPPLTIAVLVEDVSPFPDTGLY